MSQIKRATCVEELLALLENVFNDQNTNFDEFKQRPDDIIISPFAKSGTTWLQQSLHGIRSRGDMNFSEITDVSPWLEAAKIGDWNLNAEQAFQPRLFKSHLPFNQLPKGTKYVCSLRNPFSQLLSFYRFFEDWWFEKDSISIGDFARGIMLRDIANRGYWYHLCSWWKERHNPNVLLLCYENMISDLEKTIVKISDFMNVHLDDGVLRTVVHQSSKKFMLCHNKHFDDHHFKKQIELHGGPPVNPEKSKVTKGTPESSRYSIPEAITYELNCAWKQIIYERFKLESYKEIQNALI